MLLVGRSKHEELSSCRIECGGKVEGQSLVPRVLVLTSTVILIFSGWVRSLPYFRIINRISTADLINRLVKSGEKYQLRSLRKIHHFIFQSKSVRFISRIIDWLGVFSHFNFPDSRPGMSLIRISCRF